MPVKNMPPSRPAFAARHPRLTAVAGVARSLLPPLDFITIHYAYFIVTPLVFSLIFWGSSTPALSISYTDSLFLVVSAMTESGLNTVNLSQMTTWQQAILFLLIILGSSIWVSIWTVAFRRHVFELRFDTIVSADRERRMLRNCPATTAPPNPRSWGRIASIFYKGQGKIRCNADILPLSALSTSPPAKGDSSPDIQVSVRRMEQLDAGVTRTTALESGTTASGHISFADRQKATSSSGACTPQTDRKAARRLALSTHRGSTIADEKHDGVFDGSASFLSGHPIGRNAQFHGLTREEREELGGCEYRALKLLCVIVPLYFVLWQVLGCIALGAWINCHMASTATANGINPWWLGIFNGASAFNNSGMSLLDANMVPFQNAYFVLITMGMMILAGNTAYPVLLRLILWSGLKIANRATRHDQLSETKETVKFILQYPRRVYTNLFPARPTWWLLFMILLLNCIDWVAFELMNLGNPLVDNIPTGPRILDGLFQAIAVRSGGFYIVPMSEVYIGLQVLYVIMMYISVYPVVITMRHSNVYEERSLGIYYDDPSVAAAQGDASSEDGRDASKSPFHEIGRAIGRAFMPWHRAGVAPQATHKGQTNETRISFISQQIHGQLAHDLWLLVLAVLVITTIETSHFLADPVSNSVFNVIFEVVSAYGCVGISMGVPNAAYSFSGGWHSASKIVLCLVMIRGRHRGLPVALDRAVRLPGEQLHRDEEEDYHIRRSQNIPAEETGKLVGTVATGSSADSTEPKTILSVPSDSLEHGSLKYSLLGPSLLKAGQETVDQAKLPQVSDIIYNASKGSKYFDREEERDKVLSSKIEQILAKKARLERLDLSHDLRIVDGLVAQYEASRDLSQYIVHVDCDAFYAAVELLDRPELADVPFAVGGGVLTTCNYAARKFGCRSGMAGFVAKKLCPQLVLLKPDFTKYTAKAQEIRQILADYDPRFESASIDEAYLNVTQYCAENGMEPAAAVEKLRLEVAEQTKVTVSAGIAANTRLAKICSNMNKPNGQYVLPNDRTAILEFMADLPCRKVNGVGRVFERELAAVGVKTCGDVYKHRMFLSRLFGEKACSFLVEAHLGLGRTRVQPAEDYERKSVGTESTFSSMSDPSELRHKLQLIAGELEKDLQRASCKGRTLVLKVKLHTFEVYTRQSIVPRAIHLADDLYNFALPMLTKLEQEMPGMTLRLMGLRCTHLVSTKRPDAIAFFGIKPSSGSAVSGGSSIPVTPVARGAGEEADELAGAGGEWEVWPGEEFGGQEMPTSTGGSDVLSNSHEDPHPHIGTGDTAAIFAPTVSSPVPLSRLNIPNPIGSNTTVRAVSPEEWWSCPVCLRPQAADERQFNSHIDSCLSRRTILEAVQESGMGGQAPAESARLSPEKRNTGLGPEKKRGRPTANATVGKDPRQKKICFRSL
ncbi:impb mucb samb family protein [Ophiostoma piceae UAMH 11346]|uniref:DNA polymerase kappa n=1 Tax=Ophiostoma piceae (strain UAMH 11346) TaxID=1262450 RepID=S3BTU4_OPHP1|nr:impb mucb samb family protein [Ophiostoma piceae UAMH 11346]